MTLLSSIGVSHKLDSGALHFDHETGDGRGLPTVTQTRPRSFTQLGASAEFRGSLTLKSDIPGSRILQTRLLPFKTAEVSKMKVCTAHDTHSSEVCEDEALLGIVSNFSAFLSEALLGLFCKHFFRISLSLIRVQKAQNCENPQKCGRLEAL